MHAYTHGHAQLDCCANNIAEWLLNYQGDQYTICRDKYRFTPLLFFRLYNWIITVVLMRGSAKLIKNNSHCDYFGTRPATLMKLVEVSNI